MIVDARDPFVPTVVIVAPVVVWLGLAYQPWAYAPNVTFPTQAQRDPFCSKHLGATNLNYFNLQDSQCQMTPFIFNITGLISIVEMSINVHNAVS